MKSRRWLLIMLATTASVLGCEFQGLTTIRANGSGELRTEVGFTADERARLEAQAGPNRPQNFCNVPSDQTTSGVTITEEQRGAETWCVTTTRFDDLRELRRLYEDRKGIRVNRLEISAGQLFYDVDIDTSSRTSDFSVFSRIEWTVVLPSAPTYHNDAQVDGSSLTWSVAAPDRHGGRACAEPRERQPGWQRIASPTCAWRGRPRRFLHGTPRASAGLRDTSHTREA
jgi:hypothetical protein